MMSTSRSSGSRFYRPELDTLRFIAFFGVFLIHSEPSTENFYINHGYPIYMSFVLAKLVQSGGFGVDLFFCLSSFLITSILIREENRTKTINIRSFYIRRVLRIWPLYMVGIFIFLVLLPILDGDHLSWKTILEFIFFSGNWVTAFGHGDNDAAHLWSISVEEQFYILWPLLLVLFGSKNIRKMGIIIITITIVTRFSAVFTNASPDMRWTNTVLRLDPIVVGAIIASVIPEGFSMKPIFRVIIGAIGISLPALCLSVFGLNNWYDMLTYPLVAIACGLVLIAMLQPNEGLLSNPITVYLGKISFGLYVYHVLAIKIGQSYSHVLGIHGKFIIALLITILLATISYFMLEVPFLRLKERFAKVPSRPV